jgi:transposase
MGMAKWKVCSTTAVGQKPRTKSVDARRMDLVMEEIRRAKARFGLPAEAEVHVCYEAGRDGFWAYRWLTRQGLDTVLVDSSSIEVNRRQKRAKTDRVDGEKLAIMLVRYQEGDRRVWSVVQVPSVEEEDARQLHRELKTLRGERTKHINRMKGLLIGMGIDVRGMAGMPGERLAALRLSWDTQTDPQGAPLPAGLRERLGRENERLELVERQIEALEEQRAEVIGRGSGVCVEKVRRLLNLHAVGVTTAWTLVMEFFGWRTFRNRREVGSLSGLVPVPYDSGGSERSQGISKAGNPRVRALMIELGWGWVRWQEGSALSRWYGQRFAGGSKRQRKIGIVALARKLIVALWRYVETGEPPEGAKLVDWRTKIPWRLQQELEEELESCLAGEVT